jgi:hypothetical protein
MKNAAQGTIEYLVIIAVIVVLALIVVALFVSVSSSPAEQILSSSGKLGGVSVGGISIVESVADPNGDALINVSNNYGDSIYLTKVTLCNGVENTYGSGGEQIVSGDSKVFLLSADACINGTNGRTCEVKLEYTTREGLSKTEYKTIRVDCVSNASGSNFGERTPPIEPSGGVVELLSCGSIDSIDGYTKVTSCDEIDGAGNYLFTSNMTCDISVSANNVNINGNYCTLTGNVNGSNSADGGNGYSFNLINLTAGDVSSTGGDTLSEYDGAGVGGNITLTDSAADDISSNGGESSMWGVGGSGGNITLTDSNSTTISSLGGIGYGGGNGGTVTLSNSRVIDAVNVSGGNSTEPSAGNGGDVISTNNSLMGLVISNGGSGLSYGGAGGSGGNITLTDSTVTTTIGAVGGVGSGNGGNVILDNVSGISAITDAINVSGADISSAPQTGGAGGTVTFTNPSTCPTHLAAVQGSININGGLGTINGDRGTVTPDLCGQFD